MAPIVTAHAAVSDGNRNWSFVTGSLSRVVVELLGQITLTKFADH